MIHINKIQNSILLVLIFFLSGCLRQDNSVTDKEDYNAYLHTKVPGTSPEDTAFWAGDSVGGLPTGFNANSNAALFPETRDIQVLKMEEEALKKAIEIVTMNTATYYHGLARNYMAQHRFHEALELAGKARDLGGEVLPSQRLLFDLHMELGHYETAASYLDSIRNPSETEYLVRLAQWKEFKGDVPASIAILKKAIAKGAGRQDTSFLLSAYTTLGDYYGRVGRVKTAYQYYLKALELDAHNALAKKGIAWIVFSCEKNPTEALRILDSVTKYHTSPDYYLLKAQIAEYMEDDLRYVLNLDAYYEAIRDPDYGDMYSTHTILLHIDYLQEYSKAVALAEREVLNRPTLQSYDLLAYSYLKKGDKAKAVHIVKNHLEGKTTAPLIVYHMAEIYKATGHLDRVKQLKPQLLKARFEMGPVYAEKIAAL
jgi:tetratricopeptide (TPR) repeat protein